MAWTLAGITLPEAVAFASVSDAVVTVGNVQERPSAPASQLSVGRGNAWQDSQDATIQRLHELKRQEGRVVAASDGSSWFFATLGYPGVSAVVEATSTASIELHAKSLSAATYRGEVRTVRAVNDWE